MDVQTLLEDLSMESSIEQAKAGEGWNLFLQHEDSAHRVIVTDAIMGAGKTESAIYKMKAMVEDGTKFIYVTPFLDEIKRVKKTVKRLTEPYYTKEDGNVLTKRSTFLKMVTEGRNIATTHSLFATLSSDEYASLKDYVLILDEVVDPMDLLDIKSGDVEALKSLINIKTDKSFTFKDSKYTGRFQDVKKMSDKGVAYIFNDYFFIWVFPPIIFKTFRKIQILTYLFEGSLLKTYFDVNSIQFHSEKLDDTDYKKKIKQLLNIYDGSANAIGGYQNAFSVSWLSNKRPGELKKIKGKIENLVRYSFHTPSKANAFTTFKQYKTPLSGEGYSRGFIVVNSRSTNEFREKKTMLYLANRYLNPTTIRYFSKGGKDVNQDQWALAEMLQWLWRGCIRDNKPMNVYIPSSRMRGLLINWLNN